MLIFPLGNAFQHKSSNEQAAVLAELETYAHAANLSGRAVAVWESGGRVNFLGPTPWHPFLRGITMQWVMLNANREIYWVA